MAKSKKTPSKAFRQKVKKIVEADVVKSIAIASVLLNILFLVSVVVLSSSSTFDHRVFTAARDRYCRNDEALTSRAKELGSKKAAQEELEVACVGKGFQPFYNEALQKYKAEVNN